MFSKSLIFGVIVVVMFALAAIVPVSAQFMNPDVDDVLDNPEEYVGKEVTLEGEVDRTYSDRTFAMEDDADVFGEDQILIISVMPTVNIQDLDRKMTLTSISELKEGKVVRASGTIRMFDRVALESEFGTLNLGDISSKFDANDPVLIMGAREYLASKKSIIVDELTVAIPEPMPLPTLDTEETVTETTVDTAEEPVAPVETEVDQDTDADVTEEPSSELPRTSTALPLIGLIGLFSATLGVALRRVR